MKVLLIQTAFIGDAILASAAVESLATASAVSEIHLLVRKGNETLFKNHPKLARVWCWNKKESKLKNLLKVGKELKKEQFDVCFNFHRFASSSIIAWLAKPKLLFGFDKNPLSFLFTKQAPHVISKHGQMHEIERNLSLLALHFPAIELKKPKLYPNTVNSLPDLGLGSTYVCFAPASVWYTKQFPKEKWIALADALNEKIKIALVGANSDFTLCNEIKEASKSKNRIVNLCGKLSLLESAELFRTAKMNYVNDSAPLHLCSAVNAPVTAFFCSTVPAFGFGPLSDINRIAETEENLACKPCGIHGKKKCPEGHFKCSNIKVSNYLIE